MATKSFFHLLRRKEKQLTFTEIMITAMILKHGVHAGMNGWMVFYHNFHCILHLRVVMPMSLNSCIINHCY